MGIRWTETEQRLVGNALESRLLSKPAVALMKAQKDVLVVSRRRPMPVDPAGYVRQLLKLVKRNSAALEVGRHIPGYSTPLPVFSEQKRNPRGPLERPVRKELDVITVIKTIRSCANAVGGMKKLKEFVDVLVSE